MSRRLPDDVQREIDATGMVRGAAPASVPLPDAMRRQLEKIDRLVALVRMTPEGLDRHHGYHVDHLELGPHAISSHAGPGEANTCGVWPIPKYARPAVEAAWAERD